MSTLSPVPILLLKTQSQPHDAYLEYFSSSSNLNIETNPTPQFEPTFIPVLEHTQNEDTLLELKRLLNSGRLKEKFGGMIFTSQRAVEAWSDAVRNVDESNAKMDSGLNEFSPNRAQHQPSPSSVLHSALDTRTKESFQTDILLSSPFPIYTVGPATSRTLSDLIIPSGPSRPKTSTPFLDLNPTLHGSDTGNGAALATFIQSHYNALQSQVHFTWHDAPRLPFVPLLGMGSENYSRRRLESDDPRLSKKPLLFLVGEARRDIIPKTLMGTSGGTELREDEKIQVDEVEVYSTKVLQSFEKDFQDTVRELEMDGPTKLAQHNSDSPAPKRAKIVVIVIFSPQGTSALLKCLGLIDENDTLTARGRKGRWQTGSTTASSSDSTPDSNTETETKYVIATIGPTTRDHLIQTFGFHPDVVAPKPSPEGVGAAITTFLKEKGI